MDQSTRETLKELRPLLQVDRGQARPCLTPADGSYKVKDGVCEVLGPEGDVVKEGQWGWGTGRCT